MHTTLPPYCQVAIKALQNQVHELETRNTATDSNYTLLNNRVTKSVSRYRVKYSAEFSVRRVFSVWVEESRMSARVDR
jgi:hypothetical protein